VKRNGRKEGKGRKVSIPCYRRVSADINNEWRAAMNKEWSPVRESQATPGGQPLTRARDGASVLTAPHAHNAAVSKIPIPNPKSQDPKSQDPNTGGNMAKIMCTCCRRTAEINGTHEFSAVPGCRNRAYIERGVGGERIGGTRLELIRIWNEKAGKYEPLVA
jgi:hypothetical protein